MVSKLNDCIGNTMSERDGFNIKDVLKLVGFTPTNEMHSLVAGSHFISRGKKVALENDEGWMSSVAFSPMLGKSIGLGFIKEGDKRFGERVDAINLLNNEKIEVEITSPHFFDPKGDRLRA